MDEIEKKDDVMTRVSLLPDYVCDGLFMGAGVEANIEILKEFNLSNEQFSKMMDLSMQIVFKEVMIENLASELEKRLGVDSMTSKEIALSLLIKKFYLAKDFFPGIEDVIIQLGGEAPSSRLLSMNDQFVKREEEMEAIARREEEEKAQEEAVSIIYDKISALISKFPEVGDQTIGSQKSIMVQDLPVPMKPAIKYWMEDYKKKAGYGNHSNLERIQYVCHDKNTRSMNSEERRQLMLILKSADGEIDLPYSSKIGKIDFSLSE